MLKNLSDISGSKILDKKTQKEVSGGAGWFPPCRNDGDGCVLVINGQLTYGRCKNGQCDPDPF